MSIYTQTNIDPQVVNVDKTRNDPVVTSKCPEPKAVPQLERFTINEYLEPEYLSSINTLYNLAQTIHLMMKPTKYIKPIGTRRVGKNKFADCSFYSLSEVKKCLENIFDIEVPNTNEAGKIKTTALLIALQCHFGNTYKNSEVKTFVKTNESALVKQAFIYVNAIESVGIKNEFPFNNKQLTGESPYGIPPFDTGYWTVKFDADGNTPLNEIELRELDAKEKLNSKSAQKLVRYVNFTDLLIYCGAFYYWKFQRNKGEVIEHNPLHIGKRLFTRITQKLLTDWGKSIPVSLNVVERSEIDFSGQNQPVTLVDFRKLLKDRVTHTEFRKEILPLAYAISKEKAAISFMTLDAIYTKQGMESHTATRLFSYHDLAFVIGTYKRLQGVLSESALSFLDSYHVEIRREIAIKTAAFTDRKRMRN